MSFWPLFSIVIVVFSIFFLAAQFKLGERYRGVKITSWALPLAVTGGIVFAVGLRGLGIALFLIGVPLILIGGYIHLCGMFGLEAKFRRPHRWDDQ
ncbi:hypothetical protein [Paraburkholderia sp. JHI869]|uniref:hypothetical protein n=1 Tax=Paraburkholderia sp. JHI869 TaxID=3112959 RepID=UPI0031820562